jgi:hypothetical protein
MPSYWRTGLDVSRYLAVVMAVLPMWSPHISGNNPATQAAKGYYHIYEGKNTQSAVGG